MQLKLTDFIKSEDKKEEKRSALIEELKEYHENLLKEFERAYEIARKARSRYLDPHPDVEILIAKNMAERVEKLMGIEGLAKRISELEGLEREEICFKIAEEIVDGKFGDFGREEALDKAIRVAIAIQTEGVVSAPIEGIAKVKIDKNDDGTEFLKIYYAGPIRSAGGTAQVISVLVGDFVRRKLGLDRYKPTREEILRYCEEIPLYKKVANLQYLPSDEEIRLIVENCPICIDGEPTEDVEVSGYRDLKRVETNRVRGGMCLVIAEGIALKAPKLKKIVEKLKMDGWEWLERLMGKEREEPIKFTDGDFKPKIEDEDDNLEKDVEKDVKPLDKYLSDIVAGRPVFSHPSEKGGFRLRYGRARNSGFATVGINPATMVILNGFIAIGTQLKVERPGKAGSVVPVTTIEGPTVRLKNGDVVRVNDYRTALTLKDEVEEIIDLGEILINYGDFLENNHPLMPSSFCYEWWIQEVRKKGLDGDFKKIDEDLALKLCDEYNVPLHPDHTYLWHDIKPEDYFYLRDFVSNGKIDGRMLVLDYDERAKKILEDLLVEHRIRDGKIVLDKWKVLVRCLGLTFDLRKVRIEAEGDTLSIVRKMSGLDVRAKAPTRIGARMGRPEKSKERRMSPPPHILFPLSLAGGKQRNIKEAINYTSNYNSAKGEIEVELSLRRCKECGREVFWLKCDCGGITEQLFYCTRCKVKSRSEICPNCKCETKPYIKRKINIKEIYEKALNNLGERDNLEVVKGVIGMTSRWKIPERVEKGILRAKHGVFVFKDGTIRFDMTDLPLTHFRPREIGVSVEKLRELGYRHDYLGNELVSEDQIVELKPQDVIISKSCAEYLVKVAKFIDDLLVKFYGLEPYYNVKDVKDLIGHLVISLAPHTSAGVLGRIIGYADVNACYAHPYFHAAKRRNCFSADTEILAEIEGEVRRITVKELYELFENERFENGVWVRDKPKVKVKVFSFDPKSNRVVLTNVVDVIKAEAPEHLIEVELEGGKRFRVTPDHFVLTYEGGVVKKRAFEVKEGDLMISPIVEFEEVDLEEIDLLEEFAKHEDLYDVVMVRGAKNFLESILSKEERKIFYDRLRYDSITLRELIKILDSKSMSLRDVPKDVLVAVRRDTVKVKRFVKVEPLLRLLGYYLAEGYARKNGSCYQVAFSSDDEFVKEEIRKTIKEAFGNLRLYEKDWKITICSRIVYLLFTRILKAGSNAYDKRIPSFVFKLPKEKVKILLSAYASGDGTSLKTTPRISFYSVNLSLLRNIELLLMSKFGIKCYFTVDKNANRGKSVVVRYHQRSGCKPPKSMVYALNIAGIYYDRFYRDVGFTLPRKQMVYDLHKNKRRLNDRSRVDYGWLLRVKKVRYVKNDRNRFVYCLNAEKYHNILINDGIAISNCDGDEDGVMLLLDGLLNFSRYFLPDKRGGQMDAPLVLTTIVDPREVDKEVHNMDTVDRYPLEFYEATMKFANPKDVVIEKVEDRLHGDYRFCCLNFTHDTEICLGVKESAYKSLKSMQDKVRAQMILAEKIRAVDEHDVAERVLTHHFLPDIIGNLRAFSRQEFRCVNCNAKFRRPPLIGKCTKCGGKLTLTVYNSSITKYLSVSKDLCERYNVSEYTKQRLKLVELEIRSLFESDVKRQVTLF